MSITLTTNLTGTGVSIFSNENILELNEKLEENISINSTDGFVVINYDRVENAKFLIFRSANDFNIELTVSGNTVQLTGSLFTFVVDDAGTTISNISQIRLSTSSTTDIVINTTIIGQTSSS